MVSLLDYYLYYVHRMVLWKDSRTRRRAGPIPALVQMRRKQGVIPVGSEFAAEMVQEQGATP